MSINGFAKFTASSSPPTKKFNFIRSFDTLTKKVDHLFVDVSAGADEMALNMISASDKICTYCKIAAVQVELGNL